MTKKTQGASQASVNVVGSSSFGRYNKISSERTYNMFISDNWLIGFPGYQKVLQLFDQGQGRGIFRSIRGDFLLVVVNAVVFRLDNALVKTQIGILATQQGEVFIDENLNSQICIVDGTNAYIYNWSMGPNLTIQNLNGAVPLYVTYHNTFFLFGNNYQSSNWFAYSFNTATTIAITSTQALQTKPDYALAIKRIPGQASNVLVFGSSVCEVYTQIGGAQNYRRNNTISIDYGCLSVDTIDSADQYIAWLAINEFNSPVIMIYSGQGASQISSDGISYELGQIQFPDQSTAAFIRIDGHLMYQLTFYNPADNVTYLYDIAEQKFYNLTDQNLDYHPARKYAYFNQQNYFASLNNGSIYQISPNLDTINENLPGNHDPNLIHELQRSRITETIRANDNDRFIVNRFSFTMEQGTDPNYQGADPPIVPYQPRVDLTISLDSGISWSSTVAYYLNPLGLRKNLINWNQLGAANEITFKLRFWGMSRFIVNNGIVELRQ